MRKTVIALTITVIGVLSALPATAQILPEDESSVVILTYFRIGEDNDPSSNTRTSQFKEHIREITNGNYNVISLSDALSAIEEQKPLPPRTIVFTFQGGYKSILQTAIPLLQQHNLPFTIFFTADSANRNTGSNLNWNDLKMLHGQKGVTLGLMPASSINLAQQNHSTFQQEINRAKTAYRETFKKEPPFFAWSNGEYTQDMQTSLRKYGFRAALGLQSGPAFHGTDNMALPTFPMTEEYAELENFQTIINALPLPVSDVEPEDPFLKTPQPAIGFSIPQKLKQNLKDLACFVSEQPKPDIKILGETRIEIRLSAPLENKKTLINCTMPNGNTDPSADPDAPQRLRWLGILLISP